MIQVQTKNRKHYPSVATKYSVEIVRGKSIEIYVEGKMVNRFELGQQAEYDSWNLIYTGPITSITDKVIQITAYPNSNQPRKHNLDINTFCWRNENFNAEKAAAHNQNESYYI